jgi:hypothetical protein
MDFIIEREDGTAGILKAGGSVQWHEHAPDPVDVDAFLAQLKEDVTRVLTPDPEPAPVNKATEPDLFGHMNRLLTRRQMVRAGRGS